jgi:hypothetical protein
MATFTIVGNQFMRIQDTVNKIDMLVPIVKTKIIKSDNNSKFAIIIYVKHHEYETYFYTTELLRDTAYNTIISFLSGI